MDKSARKIPDLPPQSLQELSTNSKGGMLVVVILIVVLATIAYFVYTKSHSRQLGTNKLSNEQISDSATSKGQTKSDSYFEQIDQDLNNLDTDLSNLDSDLQDKSEDLSK